MSSSGQGDILDRRKIVFAMCECETECNIGISLAENMGNAPAVPTNMDIIFCRSFYERFGIGR